MTGDRNPILCPDSSLIEAAGKTLDALGERLASASPGEDVGLFEECYDTIEALVAACKVKDACIRGHKTAPASRVK